jgi:hypothetical protein
MALDGVDLLLGLARGENQPFTGIHIGTTSVKLAIITEELSSCL